MVLATNALFIKKGETKLPRAQRGSDVSSWKTKTWDQEVKNDILY